MAYIFPEPETLAKYLALLRAVLLEARHLAYASDPRMANLLDAVENVPDLLCRWPDMDESIVLCDIERHEDRFRAGDRRLSSILREGPPAEWQQRWRR